MYRHFNLLQCERNFICDDVHGWPNPDNALLEDNLVKKRGWVEYSVYPLYSPQSLIAEGSANYGIEMAFPGKEKAIVLTQKYSMSTRAKAEKSISFVDAYGAYVINYNWGRDMVKEYVEKATNN
jgi:hypothetical protein